jgi:hypothetical protein
MEFWDQADMIIGVIGGAITVAAMLWGFLIAPKREQNKLRSQLTDAEKNLLREHSNGADKLIEEKIVTLRRDVSGHAATIQKHETEIAELRGWTIGADEKFVNATTERTHISNAIADLKELVKESVKKNNNGGGS